MTLTNSQSLAEKAMLVNLSISQWTAVKNDRKVTKEIAEKHGSQENMGRYNKSLVAKDALETVKKLAGAVRTEHYKRTLPWRDGGDRILSSQGYFEYTQIMRRMQSDFDAAVSAFCLNYDQFVSEARIRLNGLFNSADYPAISEIRNKFGIRMDVLPMPTSADFRVDLSDTETAKIKADIEQQSKRMLDAAMGDVWNRLRDVVSHMSLRLKAYSETAEGKVSSPFRDSLVSNITELIDLLPTLNLTNDPNLDKFARDIRANLTSYSPEQLRESEVRRQDVATRADEILAKMAAFIA